MRGKPPVVGSDHKTPWIQSIKHMIYSKRGIAKWNKHIRERPSYTGCTYPSSYCLQHASLKSVTGERSQLTGLPLNHRLLTSFIAFSASSSLRNYSQKTPSFIMLSSTHHMTKITVKYLVIEYRICDRGWTYITPKIFPDEIPVVRFWPSMSSQIWELKLFFYGSVFVAKSGGISLIYIQQLVF